MRQQWLLRSGLRPELWLRQWLCDQLLRRQERLLRTGLRMRQRLCGQWLLRQRMHRQRLCSGLRMRQRLCVEVLREEVLP
ncbi:MAG: hypothetical protein R3C99_08210 [Pirellulaceae bacterium]|nr:hypothetical protein [Planctomycetales bacterium]MCA9204127.1 hypothetical protein [Planctomycetales bacterium]MCA9208353.1 hypothetical protein [Planctomycetales bacterium]MCA9220287.1 hypothetical protein [Planctomycetales bacterium]